MAFALLKAEPADPPSTPSVNPIPAATAATVNVTPEATAVTVRRSTMHLLEPNPVWGHHRRYGGTTHAGSRGR